MRRLPITFWTTVFVTVVCVTLVALDFERSWHARRVLLEQTERNATNLARAMSEHADDTLRTAETSLADLQERIQTDGTSPTQMARLHRLMADHVHRLPELDALSAYDETGRRLVTSQADQDRAVNNADREYFQYHLRNPGAGSRIGRPVVSRATGRWVIPVSRRLDKPDGAFDGVVLATIAIDYFREFYASFDIGADGAVALLSDDGTMLVRRPFREQSIAANIGNTPLYDAYTRVARIGTGMFRSTQDGKVRLNSYRPLQHYPLFVTAALSKDEVLAHWWRDTLTHTAGVIVLAALLALFGQRLVRQMRRRLQVESKLREARDSLAGLNAALEKLALQDGLTGLANRRQFDVSLGNEFSRATRHGAPLALAMIDVDHFKAYNDRYGHGAGDICLRAAAQAIRRQTPGRAGDLAARYGGEEMAVLLPNTDVAGAHAVAERMREAIAALALPHAGSPHGIVTISAGVAAMVPRRGVDAASALLELADRALYAAKAAGRNRVADGPDSAAP
ncbi:diguanylate cyclase (GGDEF)-like protein [Pseudoduganella flava]|uniref:diguanylate cyclase n=1 Tax=Pseudoduganella flava TaxID=871742 RepID=A0A562PVG4_9BURK|nr:sensor domain-containing diguanylate cyclase [Pseudoduganella flava]QGZ39507.1 diguanylate cyclase [Pseudoduganella flava]TWI48397.1 diguanylate cyclase (GGDEF)-like protein [Pseudoduganella flava]